MSRDAAFQESDILICGGGSAGAALAGLLARKSNLSVLLCEAEPDFGPLTDGRWPRELLDAHRIPPAHDWGHQGRACLDQTDRTAFCRGRVIGGCSSVNGCVAVAGHRADYDNWQAAGNTGWEWKAVAPAFLRAWRALRVRVPRFIEVASKDA